MKFLTTAILLLFWRCAIYAQQYSKEVFLNQHNEFISFSNDTIEFRFHNNDAFSTFSVGKFLYKPSNRTRITVNFQKKDNLLKTYIVQEYVNHEEKVKIELMANNKPLTYSVVHITDMNGEKIIDTITDVNGVLSLEKIQKLSCGKEYMFTIENIGFFAVFPLLIRQGVIFSISAINYPSSVHDVRFKIKKDMDRVVIVRNKKNPIFLYRQ